MKPAILLQSAEEELVLAAKYYEQRFPGLGSRFLAELQRAIERVQELPDAGTPLRGGYRRRLLLRFPYGVLYRTTAEEIVIVAVMHMRRRPDYWRKRVP